LNWINNAPASGTGSWHLFDKLEDLRPLLKRTFWLARRLTRMARNSQTALCVATLIASFALCATGAYAGPNGPIITTVRISNMSSIRPDLNMRAPTRGADTVNRDFDDLLARFVSSASSFERQGQVDDLLGRRGSVSLSKPQVRRAARHLAATSSQPEKSRN
jgi:hypothetical protein